MSLTLEKNDQVLELQDETLTLELNFHQGLQLLNTIDQALINTTEIINLDPNKLRTLDTVKSFYSDLLGSLMLLGVRDRQFLISDASPMTLTCLMYLFKGQPVEQLLRENLSQRRMSQIEDEANYFELDLETGLDACLLPFFDKVNHWLKEKEITLQDPQGIYFKASR